MTAAPPRPALSSPAGQAGRARGLILISESCFSLGKTGFTFSCLLTKILSGSLLLFFKGTVCLVEFMGLKHPPVLSVPPTRSRPLPHLRVDQQPGDARVCSVRSRSRGACPWGSRGDSTSGEGWKMTCSLPRCGTVALLSDPGGFWEGEGVVRRLENMNFDRGELTV